MAGINPLQMIAALKKGNPQAVAENIIKENFPNDPSLQNLLQMARQGNEVGVQQFAQQYFANQGKNFNEEYSGFMNMLRNI